MERNGCKERNSCVGNWTLRLLDASPTTWTFHLHNISPPIALLDKRNLWLCLPKFKWITRSPFHVV